MDKILDWAALKEDEGKFALGFILTKELENQAFIRGSGIVSHVAAFVCIDALGKITIGPSPPFLPPEMGNYTEEDKIKILLEAKIPDKEIIKLLTDNAG